MSRVELGDGVAGRNQPGHHSAVVVPSGLDPDPDRGRPLVISLRDVLPCSGRVVRAKDRWVTVREGAPEMVRTYRLTN
jgi:hypothetical protein